MFFLSHRTRCRQAARRVGLSCRPMPSADAPESVHQADRPAREEEDADRGAAPITAILTPSRVSQLLNRCTAALVDSGRIAYPSSGTSSRTSWMMVNASTASTVAAFEMCCLLNSSIPAM